jgi:Mrp family chromosome partitioning ATPase
MGEIADALRRARAEKDGQKPDAMAPVAPKRETLDPRAQETTAPSPPLHLSAEESTTPVVISRERTGFWEARATVIDRIGPVAERWRHVALQVRRALDRRQQRSLLVTSSLRAEGKTVTTCNLALALATVAAGRRVALVDLDLRRPSVARALGLEPVGGVEDVLADRATPAEICISTDVADLDVFPVVSPVAEAHRLLSGDRLPALLSELERSYALVVCDTPPVLPVPDVPLIAPHVGACLVVARAGITRQKDFEHMLGLVPEENVIGTLFNDVKEPNRARYEYYDERSEKSDD